MSRKIVYLINPISGTKEKTRLKDLIIQRTKAAGIDFEIQPSRADGDYNYLKNLIWEKEISDIVICGGDGTLNAVADALQGTPAKIGIIPIGSGNSVALASKIPRQPSLALDIIFKGKAYPVDAFKVNEKFSCALCGIGFDADVAHEFAKQKIRGLQTYLRISTMKFFNSKPYPFEIHAEGGILKTEAYFISIANSNQFGNNFTIAPRASMSDGLLDIVIVKKMNKVILPFSVFLQVAGNNKLIEGIEYVEKKNIIYMQTDKITIKNPSHAPVHIDGEPVDTSTEFEIRIIPNCFKLIQPLKPKA
jgi:diacylglycerol kinase (ATP)